MGYELFYAARAGAQHAAYTLLTLFRSVSLRSEQKGEIAWASLMRWVCNAVVAATEAHLEAIRPRGSALVWS